MEIPIATPKFCSRPVLSLLLLAGCLVSLCAGAQTPEPHTPQELLKAMIRNEGIYLQTAEKFEYVSNERSDRTDGHLWTEQVVETRLGRVRLLTAIDGQPLPPERARQERERLQAIVADPSGFIRHEAAQHSDEEHARHMLELLPVYFLFDNVRLQGGVWHMDFRPNPAVSPSAIEDQVLHGMSGHIAIDARELRLIHIDGTLRNPVTVGFGLLANIHTGSNVSSDRCSIHGYWRMDEVKTEIHGKAALFKNVSRNSQLARSDFRLLDGDVSVQQAAELLLR